MIRALFATALIVTCAPIALHADDPLDDLLIGAPGDEHPYNSTTVGFLHWLFGSAVGLTDEGNSGIALTSSTGFGEVLATGDFNGDFLADFVEGTPSQTLLGTVEAGTIVVCLRTAPWSAAAP